MGFLQSSGGYVGTTNPFTISFGSNTTAGSLLYFVMRLSLVETTVTVSDNQNGSWTYVVSTGAAPPIVEGYFLNNKGGATTLTFTFTGSFGNGLLCIAEYSGYDTLRQWTTPNIGTGGTAASNSITYQTGDLVLSGFVGASSNDVPGTIPPTNFFLRQKQGYDPATAYCWLSDRVNASAGASGAISYGSDTDTWKVSAIAFYKNVSTGVPNSLMMMGAGV